MTPDRNENLPEIDAENGVLSHTESLDTASIGILGVTTAQVSVALPVSSDEDYIDDDVIDDEIEPDSLRFDSIEAAEAELDDDEPVVEATETGVVDIVDDAESADVDDDEIVVEPDADEIETAEAELGDDADAADVPDDAADQDEAELETEAELDAEPEAEADAEHEAQADAEHEAEADAEHEVVVDAEHEAEAEADAEHEVVVDDAEPDVDDAEPDVDDAEAEAESRGEEAEQEADDVELDAADVDVESEPAAEEAELESDADEPVAEEAVSAEPDDVDSAVAEFEADAQPAPDVESEPEREAVVEPEPEPAIESESGSEPEAEAAMDVEPEPVVEEPAASQPAASDSSVRNAVAAAPAAAAASEAILRPRSAPATRRAAHQLEERAHQRTDVTLASKRLGEFEPGRETSDLLTADRLLDPHQVVRPEPEGRWQHFVYTISGRRINLGDGKRARERKDLDRRIAVPLQGGARFVPVLSRKGGVGKTTITTLLGMALADARDDRVIAIDANPDRGTLAERIGKSNDKTIRDLVRASGDVSGYNDISSIVARDDTRLDVLASDSDPRVSQALGDREYQEVATLAAHYYSLVLTDTGTGIVHSVMGATLELADSIVIVAGLSVDEARLASETLNWLEMNGYAEQVRNAVVVLNTARPGTPLVRQDELEAHFRTRVRSVVRVPYDPLIAAGSTITFRDLQPATRLAARELAATVIEGLRAYAPAA